MTPGTLNKVKGLKFIVELWLTKSLTLFISLATSAGKRKCPGSNYTYASAIAFLSVLLRKFKFKVVRGQDIYPVYGLATLPREEVWITLEKIPMPLA